MDSHTMSPVLRDRRTVRVVCLSCTALMARGVRYEGIRAVDVWICWTCGEKTPPLYEREHSPRVCSACRLPRPRAPFRLYRAQCVDCFLAGKRTSWRRSRTLARRAS